MSSGEGIKSFVHKQALSTIYKIIFKQDTPKKIKSNTPEEIHICPNCGGKKTNEVSKTTRFCLSCDCEFDKNDNVCTILYNGELVDYHVNEFVDCG